MDSEFVIDKVLRMRIGHVRCKHCGWDSPDRSYVDICPSCGTVHTIDVIDSETLMNFAPYNDQQFHISVEQTENGQVLIARRTNNEQTIYFAAHEWKN